MSKGKYQRLRGPPQRQLPQLAFQRGRPHAPRSSRSSYSGCLSRGQHLEMVVLATEAAAVRLPQLPFPVLALEVLAQPIRE